MNENNFSYNVKLPLVISICHDLHFRMSVNELFDELYNASDPKEYGRTTKSRSPRRRLNKSSASFDFDRKIKSKNVFLSAEMISRSIFLYNVSVTLLMMKYAEGRRLLDR